MDRYLISDDIFLGWGGQGDVLKAFDHDQKKHVAVKRYHDSEVTLNMLREALIVHELKHKNIVKLEKVLVEKDQLFLVFEYITYNLNDKLGKIDTETQKKYMRQILSGISYCHAHGIMHRDLKPANLLITEKDDTLKIADFGSSRGFLTMGTFSPQVVTVDYRAPEILMGSKEYGTAIDMWSIGCIFAELLGLKTPLFEGVDDTDVLVNIFRIMGAPDEESWPGVSSLPYYLRNWSSPPEGLASVIRGIDEAGEEFLGKFLCLNPSDRIGAAEALEHDYLRSWLRSLYMGIGIAFEL